MNTVMMEHPGVVDITLYLYDKTIYFQNSKTSIYIRTYVRITETIALYMHNLPLAADIFENTRDK